MEVLAQERPVETAEPEVILVRHGFLVTLPDVIQFNAAEVFKVGKDGDVPFSDIGKDFRYLLNYEGEQLAVSVAVSAWRLVDTSVDESILTALASEAPDYTPCLPFAHVYEYLKHAERSPSDLDAGVNAPWYVFYVMSRKPGHGIWSVRAVWHNEGWSMGASPATCSVPWDSDETIFIVAPERS